MSKKSRTLREWKSCLGEVSFDLKNFLPKLGKMLYLAERELRASEYKELLAFVGDYLGNYDIGEVVRKYKTP